jgi:hypothetical protein
MAFPEIGLWGCISDIFPVLHPRYDPHSVRFTIPQSRFVTEEIMEASANSADDTDSIIEGIVARHFSERYSPRQVDFVATGGASRSISTWVAANQTFFYKQSGGETPYIPGDWRMKAIESVSWLHLGATVIAHLIIDNLIPSSCGAVAAGSGMGS